MNGAGERVCRAGTDADVESGPGTQWGGRDELRGSHRRVCPTAR